MVLREFGPEIWIADGPPVSVFGPLKLPTRMIVVRLGDGSLWINSPIDASPEEMPSVARLGEVRHLVAPTSLHRWRLGAWKARFPQARLWAPPAILSDDPPAAWARDLDQTVMRGNAFLAEVEFYHPQSRTLVFADFIQNYPPQPHRPLLDALIKISGAMNGGVPNDIKLSFTNKALARRSLRKLLSWDFDNLIVAHGDCVTGGAKAVVERAFRFL
ncbi:MAG TPA: DUF4336 domain-containing protein [Candidatus Baltobacteraceae bacterium]|nr:DUF4336 domain-containing protein [Candidatus Baltobacteraceae bacterium]